MYGSSLTCNFLLWLIPLDSDSNLIFNFPVDVALLKNPNKVLFNDEADFDFFVSDEFFDDEADFDFDMSNLFFDDEDNSKLWGKHMMLGFCFIEKTKFIRNIGKITIQDHLVLGDLSRCYLTHSTCLCYL